MRRLLLLAFLSTLVSPSAPASSVQILEIGLQGFYSWEPIPTRVRVLVQNPSTVAQTIKLSFRTRDLRQHPAGSENKFTLEMKLDPHDKRIVEVPLLILQAGQPLVEVEARDARDVSLGRDQRPPEVLVAGGFDSLMAILCTENTDCQAVQSGITFSGDADEKSVKGKALKFVTLSSPESHWWSYLQAEAVVVATPVKQFSLEQRNALEEYTRQGGRLLLIEDKVGDPEFLAKYRQGPPNSRGIILGKGMLYRISTASPEALHRPFATDWMRTFLVRARSRLAPSELAWTRKRLATAFRFPTLGWLLTWFGIYTVVVGVLNFAILRRLGRREWGWFTVPVIAVLFALGIYASSANKRPKQMQTDEIAVYWMDDRSPVAAMTAGVRISSPRRRRTTVTVPGDVVFTGQSDRALLSFASMMQEGSGKSGWNVTLGSPSTIELSHLQWSFRDLEFGGMKNLPGTMRRIAPMRLRNETAENFQQAILVDKDNVYFLGTVAPGAEIDLAAARKVPLNSQTNRTWGGMLQYPQTAASTEPEENGSASSGAADFKKHQEDMEEWRRLPQQPFALAELIRAWPKNGGRVFDNRSALFFGLSDETVLGASLGDVPFVRKSHALVVVSFAPQP